MGRRYAVYANGDELNHKSIALGNIFFSIVIIILSIAVIALVLSSYSKHGNTSRNERKCTEFAEINADYEVMYTRLNGCLIKVDGIWVHVNNLGIVTNER